MTKISERLKLCQDYFEISKVKYEDSRQEALEVVDLYHNRQYTAKQLGVLAERGQPAETFNVVKMYSRMIRGYLSTVVNSIIVKAEGTHDTGKAALGQDVVDHTTKKNNFKMIKSQLQKDLGLTGLCGIEIDAINTGKVDEFGNVLTQVTLDYIPWDEIGLDPLHRKPDYSDGRFIHKWKWMPYDQIVDLYGKVKADQLSKNSTREDLQGYSLSQKLKGEFVGRYSVSDMHLVIETQYKKKDEIKILVWSGDVELENYDITPLGRFKLQPTILEEADKPQHYGIMREITETQKAINQALIQIQLLVNTKKAFVQKNAVDNMAEFERKFNRVNAVIKVKNLQGIDIVNMSADIAQQYTILDNALTRCERILGLTESFLGMAGSSASGRQVKLQQNSSVVALSYFTERIEFLLEQTGKMILSTAQLYYKGHTFLRVSDQLNQDRWAELNKPFTILNSMGQEELVFEDEFDVQEDGTIALRPIMDPDTQLDGLEYDLEITTSPYEETDDIERLTMESIISGHGGQMMAQASPGDYFELVGMSIQGLKTRNSEFISQKFFNLAKKLGASPTMDPRLMNKQGGGQQGGSPIGEMISALGMDNDAQPEGYNNVRS
jgi:hypothetical protein